MGITQSTTPASQPQNLNLFLTIAATHITNGHYRQASDALHQAKNLIQQATNDPLYQLLELAHCLCLKLEHQASDLDWHRKAIQEGISHQTALTDQFRSLLSAIDEMHVEQSSPLHTPSNGLPNVISMDTVVPSFEAENRWQNLKDFFRRGTPASPTSEVHTSDQGWRVEAEVESPLNNLPDGNSLVVYTLGTFQVYLNEELVENLISRKGNLILKYLLVNRERQVHKEVLMDLFWGDSEEEAQRNNLNVAVYNLRQALRNSDPAFSHILFQNDCYFLNPELNIWVDYEAFMEHYKEGHRYEQQGQWAEAAHAYQMAEPLYQGIFLPEDTYEDWTENRRHSLQSAYLSLLNSLSRHYLTQNDYAGCVTACNKILEVDACFEEAYVRLMRCYSRQGQTYLALRQYDRCLRTLQAELEIEPEIATTHLYEQLRGSKRI